MWSELVHLAQRRYRTEPQTRDVHARSLTALYGALTNCQIAFERLDGDASIDKSDAVLAMEVVFLTLHNVQPLLQLFDEPLAQELTRYVRSELLAGSGAPTEKLKRQVETLRRLLALEADGRNADVTAPSAFSGARRQLAAFMRETYSSEELFPAW